MPALPARPCLRQLRHQAKDLLKALRANAPDAQRRVDAYWTGSRGSPPTLIRLTDAQAVVAHEVGFASWTRMKQHVEGLPRTSEPADAVQETFAPATGWRWHMEPAPCDGRATAMTSCDGVVVHVMPGQMDSTTPSVAPPLAVYIAQGGGEEYPRRQLRPVLYAAAGERHALRSDCGSDDVAVRVHGFRLSPAALPLDGVVSMGVEVRIPPTDNPA